MMQTLFRKKLNNEQMANVFVNGLLEVIDNSFPILAELINDDPAFVQSPNVSPTDSHEFFMILFAANLNLLESTFEPENAHEIEGFVMLKLSAMEGVTVQEYRPRIKEYQSFLWRVNHPSKNLVYGMSKSFFAKYNLNQYQDEYFRRLAAPNPLLLKRLDEITRNFIWDWDAFFKRFKL